MENQKQERVQKRNTLMYIFMLIFQNVIHRRHHMGAQTGQQGEGETTVPVLRFM